MEGPYPLIPCPKKLPPELKMLFGGAVVALAGVVAGALYTNQYWKIECLPKLELQRDQTIAQQASRIKDLEATMGQYHQTVLAYSNAFDSVEKQLKAILKHFNTSSPITPPSLQTCHSYLWGHK